MKCQRHLLQAVVKGGPDFGQDVGAGPGSQVAVGYSGDGGNHESDDQQQANHPDRRVAVGLDNGVNDQLHTERQHNGEDGLQQHRHEEAGRQPPVRAPERKNALAYSTHRSLPLQRSSHKHSPQPPAPHQCRFRAVSGITDSTKCCPETSGWAVSLRGSTREPD